MNETQYLPIDFLQTRKPRAPSATDEKWPKISIVMPSFNQARFIERSILSVLNQDYHNIQLIVVDGGSTDGTVEIIKKYESEIDYWVSEKDEGQSDALNKGFARANGKIFGWLNSDDLYLPGALRIAATALQNQPDKSIAFGDWLSVDESDRAIDLHYAFDFNLKHFKCEGFHLNAQSMFWTAQTHQNFKGFDIGLHNTMDYQMILEFGTTMGDKKFLRIPEVLGAFRRHQGQKTAGLTPRVLNEHKKLAIQYQYNDKYNWLGKFHRLPYRFRRAYWYFLRGGLSELSKRLKISYNNAH